MKKLTREQVAEMVRMHHGPRRLSSYAIAREFAVAHQISIDRTTVLHHLRNSPEARHERGRVASQPSPVIVVAGERVREGKSYKEIAEASEWRRQEKMALCPHDGEVFVVRKCKCCGKVSTTTEQGRHETPIQSIQVL